MNGIGILGKGIFAAIATFVTAYVGGWDTAMTFLIWAMIIDYVSGVLAATKTKSLNSDVMFWGGVRKAITILIVGLCVKLDLLMGNDQPIYRTMAVYYYIGREVLSVIENTGKLGVNWPAAVKDRLTQLNGGGDKPS